MMERRIKKMVTMSERAGKRGKINKVWQEGRRKVERTKDERIDTAKRDTKTKANCCQSRHLLL
jgi:hypothetical protein